MTFPRWAAVAQGAIPCIEGFCVENASPELIRTVAAAPNSEVWALDDPSGGAARWDGTSWVTVCVPGLGHRITAGHAASLDDVWFGGYGALAHWDGASFQLTPAPTSSSIERVWGNAREAFALDGDGVVLRWDGLRWSRSYTPAAPAAQASRPGALWGDGSGRAWVVSDKLVEWSGGQWTSLEAPVATEGMSLWADAANVLWVAGVRRGESRASIFRREGAASFVPVPAPSEHVLLSPAADGPWLSFPGDPTAWRWDGTEWAGTSPVPHPTALDFPTALFGLTATDAWRATDRGLYEWNGCRWSLALDTSIGPRFLAVETTSATDAWILGWQQGLFLWHRAGASWQELPLAIDCNLDPTTFAMMSASSPTNAWVVSGCGDVAAHWDGAQITRVPLPEAGSRVTALFTRGPDETWVAYGAGRVARWAGGRWTHVDSGSPQAIVRLRANGADDVWALNIAGTVLHFDGVRWVPHSFGDSAPLSLWTTDRNDVWVATAAYLTHDPPELGAATLHHWDGTLWTEAPNVDPAAITGSGPTDIWVTGRNWATSARDVPALYHFDGTRWSQFRGFDAFVASGAPDGEIWATDGRLLYHRTARR
jgi:hypothetical protein